MSGDGNACSFCGKREHQVRRLAPGLPSVFICNECIDLCRDIIADVAEPKEQSEFVSEEELKIILEQISKYTEQMEAGPSVTVSHRACSFCGDSEADVRKLIAGPTVYICDACVRRCGDVLAET